MATNRDHERGGDHLPGLERHLAVGDHVEDVAAGPELVGHDGRERDDERERAETGGRSGRSAPPGCRPRCTARNVRILAATK